MTANTLKSKLKTACNDLWWSSESDYPVKVVWNPAAPEGTSADSPIAVSAVREMFGCADDMDVQIVDIEDFFERAIAPKSWHTKEDREECDRLLQLKVLLTNELEHLQVYRCGKVEINVYVLGYTDDRNIAGVKTILVET